MKETHQPSPTSPRRMNFGQDQDDLIHDQLDNFIMSLIDVIFHFSL